MALDSSSTLQDALDQRNDNLLWEGSPSKARLALEAIRWLLTNRALISANDGVSLSFAEMSKEKQKLENYVDNVGQGASRRTSFTRGRPM